MTTNWQAPPEGMAEFFRRGRQNLSEGRARRVIEQAELIEDLTEELHRARAGQRKCVALRGNVGAHCSEAYRKLAGEHSPLVTAYRDNKPAARRQLGRAIAADTGLKLKQVEDWLRRAQPR